MIQKERLTSFHLGMLVFLLALSIFTFTQVSWRNDSLESSLVRY